LRWDASFRAEQAPFRTILVSKECALGFLDGGPPHQINAFLQEQAPPSARRAWRITARRQRRVRQARSRFFFACVRCSLVCSLGLLSFSRLKCPLLMRLFGTVQPADIPESTEWWKRQQRDLFAMSDDAELGPLLTFIACARLSCTAHCRLPCESTVVLIVVAEASSLSCLPAERQHRPMRPNARHGHGDCQRFVSGDARVHSSGALGRAETRGAHGVPSHQAPVLCAAWSLQLTCCLCFCVAIASQVP
jgi:hypothetical protein